MDSLCFFQDFRNYAYTVPAIEGFVIHMEDKKTSLLFPKNRYEQVTLLVFYTLLLLILFFIHKVIFV